MNTYCAVLVASGLWCIAMNPACAQGVIASQREDKRALSETSARIKRPITIKETLSTRKVNELQISPDGRKIVFIVTQAFLEQNEDRTALYLLDTNGEAGPLQLLDG